MLKAGLKGHPGFQNHVPVPVLPENAHARALFGWFSKSRARARARALGPWPVPFFPARDNQGTGG